MRLTIALMALSVSLLACSASDNSRKFGLCESWFGGVPDIQLDKITGKANFGDVNGSIKRCVGESSCLEFPLNISTNMFSVSESGLSGFLNTLRGEKLYTLKSESLSWSYAIDRKGYVKRLTLEQISSGDATTYRRCAGSLRLYEISNLKG